MSRCAIKMLAMGDVIGAVANAFSDVAR